MTHTQIDITHKKMEKRKKIGDSLKDTARERENDRGRISAQEGVGSSSFCENFEIKKEIYTHSKVWRKFV